MKNLHLEHPEDTILTGDLSVLNWFTAPSTMSVKIDGAPAIVWGTNPQTKKFFVGTKSVFNKVKVKINYTHEDIDTNHEGAVAIILHCALDCLPRTEGIVQGDFIGFGGDDTYQPNTVTYVFDQKLEENIIIAPHTFYTTDGDLRDAEAHPLCSWNFELNLFSTEKCRFIQPNAFQLWETIIGAPEKLQQHVDFARAMSQMCEFVDDKKAVKIKKVINTFLKTSADLDPEALAVAAECDVNLMRFWKLIHTIKMCMLEACDNNGPRAVIGGLIVGGEGYVRSNTYGMMKLVDREVFSAANFSSGRFSKLST